MTDALDRLQDRKNLLLRKAVELDEQKQVVNLQCKHGRISNDQANIESGKIASEHAITIAVLTSLEAIITELTTTLPVEIAGGRYRHAVRKCVCAKDDPARCRQRTRQDSITGAAKTFKQGRTEIMSDLHDRDDDMEKKVAEMARIEKLKGPSPFTPSEPLISKEARQTEYERLEALKQPRVPPPHVPPDFVAQTRERLEREARHERLKAATGSRLT